MYTGPTDLHQIFLPCPTKLYRILKLEFNIIIIDPHSIRSQMLLPNMMHILPYKLTQIFLYLLLHRINPKRLKKLLRRPHLPQPIQLLILMDPLTPIDLRIHINNTIQPHHRLTLDTTIHVRMLPIHFNLMPFPCLILTCIIMKTNRPFGGIIVIPVGKPSQTHGNLLPHENHGEMLIIGYIDYEMTPGETKPRRPEGFERGFTFDTRGSFWLLSVA
mmetsp:Transcript_34790/g.39624  ORF Transcript_34790/g.39624 Transcript_34790/m.39624 type:complete len:217 (-) Transcript_34790:1149-1799(-)